jgi:methyl-accepting chemotaxis protein
MRQRWRPVRDERGQGPIVLFVVLVVVAVTVGFLLRTLLIGMSINEKAEDIARTGRGINTATDAILQLDRTEGFGRTIHESTDPLEGKVNQIVGQATSIDNTASSINNSATSIGGSANSIGGAVSSIQSLARLVDRDAQFINDNVASAREVAARIHGDLNDRVNAALADTEAQAQRIVGALCAVLLC